jgi:SAD/SRA domain
LQGSYASKTTTTFDEPQTIDGDDDKDTLQPDVLQAGTSSSRSTINHDPLNDTKNPARDMRAYMRQLEYEFPVAELRYKVKWCCQQVKKVHTQQQKRECEKRYGIDVIIPKFWLVDMMDSELEQKTGLKSVLKLIGDRGQGFSKLAAKLAGVLYKRFERQNWGLSDEEDDEALFFPEEPAENEPSSRKRHVNAVASTNKSASAMSGPSAIPNASSKRMKPDVQEDMRPPKRHAIYGRGKIMDGIWLRRNTNKSTNTVTHSRILDPTKKHLLANKFGSNGIEHGTWWPKQICLVRDGAHGCIQGGIYGNLEDGAFSIIVSGSSYSGLDEDHGDYLYYSAPKPEEGATSNKRQSTDRAQILRQSLCTQKSVRVIRGASKPNKYAPPVGLRYDGLYTVAEEGAGKTVNGVALAQFKLVRRANQPAIDLFKPDSKQQTLFESIKLEY